MFSRPEESYALDPAGIGRILDDQANPLCQISAGIAPASTVLDVGAGNGILAQLLAARSKKVEIDGVEPSPIAARLAAAHYRCFHHGNLDQFAQGDNPNGYDNIVLADVIEHTQDPALVLSQVKERLTKGGKIWLSVPNVAFASIRAELLSGSWSYSDWGILERTHLRFFNLQNLLELLSSSGFVVDELVYLCRSPFLMDKQIQDYDLDLLSLLRIKRDPLSFVYQFLAVCVPVQEGVQVVRRESWIALNTHLVREYFARRWAKPR
ncbi:bifunctional 2-polyprenyl-6-hydroxyphenol methylase/3-demethylubiquinol 3-O-methyltransferase UbiG [Cyanobium sp. Morenito 9A2]|uniref:class I SAM-dependent methyltransferase n=1 Tax=Cyanobium sp. Morenito 9A2 TaxID=2823718 RepID=UPI0020CCA6C1|nr:class I SAM-dependent methyltransferase [Cyanobium sp. Morenito 9A2]MCP9850236.1 class I SAM-dependent methyltransferase [Cyanobium sp. Morenito 9A2]